MSKRRHESLPMWQFYIDKTQKVVIINVRFKGVTVRQALPRSLRRAQAYGDVCFLLHRKVVFRMSFLQMFKRGPQAKRPKEVRENVVYAPVEGELIPLGQVDDEAFASGSLGDGCAIRPTDGTVYAPVSGTVKMVFPTGHAVGIVSTAGMELLIHVGINTVEMNGAGFHALVSAGQTVQAGDPLLTFDRAKIREAGYDSTVIMVAGNGKDFPPFQMRPPQTVAAMAEAFSF